MADIRTLSRLYRPQPPALTSGNVLTRQSVGVRRPETLAATSARTGNPYVGASTGRRAFGWNPTKNGANTNLWSNLDVLRARCRDQVRNDPWALSAADTFESQIVGSGIAPHWVIDNQSKKAEIEDKFDIWARSTKADKDGRYSFYGMQALWAREIYEAGEVFIRRWIRSQAKIDRFRLPLGLQLQTLESEQLPINEVISSMQSDTGNRIRCGIEFDGDEDRVAYHFYRHHPGETTFYPADGLDTVRVKAENIVHAFKPLRAGQLRGQPHLATVLSLLYELDQYSDDAVLKKRIQTLFVGFIKKSSLTGDILPQDNSNPPTDPISVNPVTGSVTRVANSPIEGGTMQVLGEGEDITFPSLPAENDLESFYNVQLHRLAVGCGLTYEQLTGDLRGVNLSSIRAGLLDFRRKAEQLQLNIFVAQLVQPVVAEWWLEEAVFSGQIKLIGYTTDRSKFQNISWGLPGWPWTDPVKDAQAAELEIKMGTDSRENIVAKKGGDATTIDKQQADDNKRAAAVGLMYTTRTDLPLTPTQVQPDSGPAGGDSSAPMPRKAPMKPRGPQKAALA